MKITKRILSLLLVLALAFSIVACGEPKPCDEHIDENNDGVCDREGCGELIPGKAVSEAIATSYVEAVFDMVETAKTISFVAEIDTTITSGAFRDKAGNLMTIGEEDEKIIIDGTANFTISYIEERVDFKCELSLTADVAGEIQEINEAIYFIDGVLYTQAVNDVWYGERITAEMLMSMLPPEVAELLSGIDLDSIITAPTEEDVAELKSQINDAINGMFKVNEDGSIGIGFDYAELINPYLQSIKAIDGEDTIASVVNPYLMSAGVTTTLESLIDAFSLSGTKTVGELYSALNVYLTQNTGKNLQGIFDEIMAIPELKQALVMAELCTEAEFEELKAIKLDTAIADYTALTVDELLLSTSEEGETPNTVAELGAMIKTVVTTPLSEMEGFSELEATMDFTTLDSANDYFSIKLDKELGFEEIKAGSELVFTTLMDTATQRNIVYYSTVSVDFAFEISITAISTETTTISIPEDEVFITPTA